MRIRSWVPAPLFLLIGACATPGAVTDLASVTAANVSVVNSSLARFAEDSKALSVARAQTMQDLSNQLNRSERQLAEDIIILERMDGEDDYEALERLLSQSRRIRVTERQAQDRDLLDEIVSAQSELVAPTNALKDVSKTLASLGEKREAKARVRFFARFASEVVDDIEQARELQDLANRDAQRLVADAKLRGDQRVADAADADE